ncbi:MAG: type II toxin-antitoxin system RelE/ParE family toxin [Candidatus Sungbacteria bacterium]|nr:type II toxin-antitoxin system RelE/ParE family toxin [Candidatus Sungbacteria bacterium]
MNSSKGWDLQIDSSVFRAFKKIPRSDIENLLVAIRLLPENPYFGDIQKMKGENGAWRRRIGSYRIFYRVKIAERVVLVFHLERRTSKTY